MAAVPGKPAMLGPVASEATARRTFDQCGPVEMRGIATAASFFRADAGRRIPCRGTIRICGAGKGSDVGTGVRSVRRGSYWRSKLL